MKPYDVYMIDPPWPYPKPKLHPNKKDIYGINAALIYDVMSLAEIESLLLKKIFSHDEPCSLFLWHVERMMQDSDKLAQALGFRRMHCRFIWDKGNGFPATGVRIAHEYLSWWWRGKFIKPACFGKYSTVLRESRTGVSIKPLIAYIMIEEFYPEASRLEVFSRTKRKGWKAWGKEVGKLS